jgi:hypothetical protein
MPQSTPPIHQPCGSSLRLRCVCTCIYNGARPHSQRLPLLPRASRVSLGSRLGLGLCHGPIALHRAQTLQGASMDVSGLNSRMEAAVTQQEDT